MKSEKNSEAKVNVNKDNYDEDNNTSGFTEYKSIISLSNKMTKSHSGKISSLIVLKNKNIASCSEFNILVWNILKGTEENFISTENYKFRTKCIFEYEDNILAVGGYNRIGILDLSTSKFQYFLECKSNEIIDIVYVNDNSGRKLIIGCSSLSIFAFNLIDKSLVHNISLFQNIFQLNVLDNSNSLAVCSSYDISFLNINDFTLEKSFLNENKDINKNDNEPYNGSKSKSKSESENKSKSSSKLELQSESITDIISQNNNENSNNFTAIYFFDKNEFITGSTKCLIKYYKDFKEIFKYELNSSHDIGFGIGFGIEFTSITSISEVKKNSYLIAFGISYGVIDIFDIKQKEIKLVIQKHVNSVYKLVNYDFFNIDKEQILISGGSDGNVNFFRINLENISNSDLLVSIKGKSEFDFLDNDDGKDDDDFDF